MNGIETIVTELKGLSGRVNRMDINHREDFRAIQREVSDLGKAVAGLKVKAGMWGALAGLIPATLVLVLAMLKAAAGE